MCKPELMKKLALFLPLLALACSPSVRYVGAGDLETIMAKCGVTHSRMTKSWLACVEGDVATGLTQTPNQVNYSNGVVSIMESTNELVASVSKRKLSRKAAGERLDDLLESIRDQETQARQIREIRRNSGPTFYGGTGWGRFGRGGAIGSGWRF